MYNLRPLSSPTHYLFIIIRVKFVASLHVHFSIDSLTSFPSGIGKRRLGV